jgi:hypothetical protein
MPRTNPRAANFAVLVQANAPCVKQMALRPSNIHTSLRGIRIRCAPSRSSLPRTPPVVAVICLSIRKGKRSGAVRNTGKFSSARRAVDARECPASLFRSSELRIRDDFFAARTRTLLMLPGTPEPTDSNPHHTPTAVKPMTARKMGPTFRADLTEDLPSTHGVSAPKRAHTMRWAVRRRVSARSSSQRNIAGGIMAPKLLRAPPWDYRLDSR